MEAPVPPNAAPDAAALRESAARAASAILARRAALDAEGRRDEPLIVLAGEFHNEPSHQIHHLLVLDALRQSETVAYAAEEEHNLLQQKAAKVTRQALWPGGAERLRAADRRGALSLQAALGFYCSAGGEQHGWAALVRFLRAHGIPVRFTDAARPREKLDPSDPSTRASLTACFGRAAHSIDARDPGGMQARNHHMAAMLAAYARETGARIVFQQCGDAHIAGCVSEGWTAEHSLSRHLKKLGLPILAMPICMDVFNETAMPADHGLTPEEWHAVADLPSIPHHRFPYEGSWVAARLTALGHQDAIMPAQEYWQQKAFFKKAVFDTLSPDRL